MTDLQDPSVRLRCMRSNARRGFEIRRNRLLHQYVNSRIRAVRSQFRHGQLVGSGDDRRIDLADQIGGTLRRTRQPYWLADSVARAESGSTTATSSAAGRLMQDTQMILAERARSYDGHSNFVQ